MLTLTHLCFNLCNGRESLLDDTSISIISISWVPIKCKIIEFMKLIFGYFEMYDIMKRSNQSRDVWSSQHMWCTIIDRIQPRHPLLFEISIYTDRRPDKIHYRATWPSLFPRYISVTSHHVTWRHTMWHDVTQSYMTSYHVTWRLTMWHDVLLCRVTSNHMTLDGVQMVHTSLHLTQSH